MPVRGLVRLPDDLVAFHDAILALSRTRETFGPMPVAPIRLIGTDSRAFGPATMEDYLEYLQRLYTTVLRNYRGLVEANFPRLAPHLPTLALSPIYLHIVVDPVPHEPPQGLGRAEGLIEGQPATLHDVGVRLAWGRSSGPDDEVHVSPAPAGLNTWHPDFDDERAPWWPQPIQYIQGAETHRLVQDSALTEAVYRLLDDDLSTLFGHNLWRPDL